ncbi:hypothetical protein [Phyllobacterium sp. SB3]|uniref:hypothetical protein n=1 Tax=Phyllobacterium sp. SB3 TaxID=3156073 RepID=UPI0032AE81E3
MNNRKEPERSSVPLWIYLLAFGIALVTAILAFLFLWHPDVTRFTSLTGLLFEAPRPSALASLVRNGSMHIIFESTFNGLPV